MMKVVFYLGYGYTMFSFVNGEYVYEREINVKVTRLSIKRLDNAIRRYVEQNIFTQKA